MPQRFLRPGILQSPRWNALSWPAQSFFIRLITLVDDYARFDAHPLLLARVVFPYGHPGSGRSVSVAQIEEWLAELSKEMIDVYEVDGARFLQLKRWEERVRMKNPSRFPAPNECQGQSMTASDSRREQMLSDSLKCSRVLSNAAPPTSTSTSTSTSTEGGKNKGDGSGSRNGPPEQNGAAVAASRTQWAALSKQIKDLAALGSELTSEQRSDLQKKRRALRELEKKQAAGVFS